jgi:hypothetical protein
MDSLVSGLFSLLGAFGAAYVTHYLNQRSSLASNQSRNPRFVSPSPLFSAGHSGGNVRNASAVETLNLTVLVAVAAFAFGYWSIDWQGWSALYLFALFMLGTGLMLVWYQTRTRPWTAAHLALQLQIASLWTGWITGSLQAYGAFWDDILFIGIGWWLAFAVCGSLLLVIRQQRDEINRLRTCLNDLDPQEGPASANSETVD